jgi:protein TonB
MGAGLIALDPSDLERIEIKKLKPIAVQVPEAVKAEEPPPPPPDQPAQSTLLAALAPESFSSMQDLGGGVGFGNGGNGPAIGGGGGFGGDAGTLVGQKTSVDRPPRAVLKSAPEFPQEARTRGVSGFVELKILVGLNGTIESVQVERSEPAGFFDQAAMQAVKQWRFEPGISKGQAVAAWTTQRIKFELN